MVTICWRQPRCQGFGAGVLIALLVLVSAPDAFPQCTTGAEPECTCLTAPVLCTVDELDNYQFSMSSYQHPWDGPTPLCSGFQNIFSESNNPTWFAFVAWCTDLTINVHPTNCTPFGGSNGVQVAIYSDCGYTEVVCNVAPSDCNTNDKLISMNNLVIGNTYYFLIDGCAGAYCDVEIDVIGVCGAAFIEDWTQPVSGPTQVCSGTSPTYTVESLQGATHYHWYINGILFEEGVGLTSWSPTAGLPGTYQICVDASNNPCIPESDPPGQNCITIEVFAAEAGDLLTMPNPVCPNDTIYVSASGYSTDPANHQFIVITDAAGTIVDVVSGDASAWTHDACGTFFAYSYNYHDVGSNAAPVIGASITSIDCPDGCCDQDMLPLDFVDNEAPVFPVLPPDLILACYDLVPPMEDLMWTDNCDGSGVVPGLESGTADLCSGGSLSRLWTYTDQCGNVVQYEQSITVDPLPPPAFVAPPADVTVDCNSIPASAPDLQVENTGS
ncbi:MAG: hypothetical protein R3330_01655, partial [Saprospiraceae bacterium]|nr:hypothetical protein [Saprospiraceae bacterium]